MWHIQVWSTGLLNFADWPASLCEVLSCPKHSHITRFANWPLKLARVRSAAGPKSVTLYQSLTYSKKPNTLRSKLKILCFQLAVSSIVCLTVPTLADFWNNLIICIIILSTISWLAFSISSGVIRLHDAMQCKNAIAFCVLVIAWTYSVSSHLCHLHYCMCFFYNF